MDEMETPESLSSPVDDTAVLASPRLFCAVCATSLEGPFCHACGQRLQDRSNFTVGHLLAEAFHEITSVDSKIWRTVEKLFFHPGELAINYLEGRGSLYFTPVKLFLVSLAIYFFLAPYSILSPDRIQAMTAEFPPGTAGEFLQRVSDRMANGAFYDTYQNVYTILLGLTVFLNATLLKVFFRRRYFGEHLVFALYELSFVFLLILPMSLLPTEGVGPTLTTLTTILLVLIYAVYITLALRFVYDLTWLKVTVYAGIYVVFREILDSVIAFAAIFVAAR